VTDAYPAIFTDFAWGTRTLVEYKNSKGQRLQATLTLPAGYEPGKRYPMLVYFYERMSDTHHNFSFPVYDDRPHMSTYASNGYLVLQPDVTYEIGKPGTSALDCVTSAVKEVIRQGYADPARIGLQGHSWGGYQSSFIGGPESDEEHLRGLRAKLLAARAARVRPATDDKLLAGWNALAVSGLVRAWNATGHAPALALALRVGGFLRAEMIRGDRLTRTWKAGAGKLDGTLEDYAFTALAMMELAEATLDRSWWDAGVALAGAIRARFYQVEKDAGVFYLTAHDDPEPLIHRPESHHDGALPSGAAVAVEVLVRLGHIADDDEALGLAERYLARRLSGDALGPLGASRLLAALDLYLHAQCVVVTRSLALMRGSASAPRRWCSSRRRCRRSARASAPGGTPTTACRARTSARCRAWRRRRRCGCSRGCPSGRCRASARPGRGRRRPS
jgi:hypothetical protein